MGCLLDALSHACDVLGFGQAAGGDEVFQGLVLARIIEPVSKADSLRVLEEAGLAGRSYATLKRRLPGLCQGGVAAQAVRRLRGPCRAGPGEPGSL